MKKLFIFGSIVAFTFLTMPVLAGTINYGNIFLSGGYQAGHFNEVRDLTAGDITITFTYDGNGLVDDYGGSAHAWAELGIRSLGSSSDFNPYWRYSVGKVDLVAGRKIDVGDVIFWRSGNNLYVKYVITKVDGLVKRKI